MNIELLSCALEDMIGDTGTKVPGLGVIIYKDGAEVYSKFLGRRNLETSKHVTRNTKFRAASVSKMFTIFTLMQLVERGKISLDDDVSRYLNFKLRNPNFPDTPITVEMLASHTSSIRDGKIYCLPPALSVKEFFTPEGKFWEGGVHFAKEPPKKFFTYCNLNYGLLGTIIESVTGKRFDLYQCENILNQLDTRADYLPGNLAPNDFELLGSIYRKKNSQGIWNEHGDWFAQIDSFGGIQPPNDTVSLQNPYAENFCQTFDLKDYRVGTNATIFSPQGGLRISFEELAHTLKMLLNGGSFRGKKILSRESLEEMFKPRWIFDGSNGSTYGGALLNYGLGIYRVYGKSSARLCKNRVVNLIGHTGAAFGLLSGIFFIPNSGTGFVYMINGIALDEDSDPRARGIFSGNYIWEENLVNSLLTSI